MFIRLPGLSDIGISLLDGMLCFHITAVPLDLFKLWAMKDYGVKESWTVLFTIRVCDLSLVKRRYRFPDGDLLLYAPGELPHQGWSFKFQTFKGKFGAWPHRESIEKGIIYTESLISPNALQEEEDFYYGGYGCPADDHQQQKVDDKKIDDQRVALHFDWHWQTDDDQPWAEPP
ncbi:hypothetical protein T459_18805 [Capsicum annuum]|uniref:F-box protein CPR30-like n=1 Tax=Capsicum annuum TaxID=4072 RepID=A0A2G2YZY0_CAPAN|nr:hypothetical protein T459_18805 [Capsicum annuum]